MNANGLVIGLVALTFATTVFVAANQGAPAQDAGVVERLDELDRRLDRIEEIAAETREEARRAASVRVAAAPAAATARVAGAASAGDGSDAAAAVDGLDAVVAESVQRSVEEQMERIATEKRNRGADGKWKPPLDDMVQVLRLDDPQREKLAAVFDAARDEAFDLLSARRADGRNLLDDFADDLRTSEEPAKAWGKLFGALATQKVPGRNQTYLKAFEEAAARIRERVAGHLSDEQAQRFRALDVDVFEVKTGYDPTGDYVKRRLEEASTE